MALEDVFTDNLQKEWEFSRQCFEKLLEKAKENSIDNELLLVILSQDEINKKEILKNSPSGGYECKGFAFENFETFMNFYISLYDPKKDRNLKTIFDLPKEDELLIQWELMLYLKLWEANDIFIFLYQFARMVKGEKYDWDYKVGEYSIRKAI